MVHLKEPTACKRQWLKHMTLLFQSAVAETLKQAEGLDSAHRGLVHRACYPTLKSHSPLPSEFLRMAINRAVMLIRSYREIRKKRQASYPTLKRPQGIGLGVHAYKVLVHEGKAVLRCSTGKRGTYQWFPLALPEKHHPLLEQVQGDALLYEKNGHWCVSLPLRSNAPDPAPAVCDGHPTVIGVDFGLVRHMTATTPDGIRSWSGKSACQHKQRLLRLQERYLRHHRSDKAREQHHREARWSHTLNHQLSRQLVDLASLYPNSVLVLEDLKGIRSRLRGSKSFNHMLHHWRFHDLLEKIQYKAIHAGIGVLLVSPYHTSQKCHRCGHTSKKNRVTQAVFHCQSCGFQTNADWNAATNIQAAGLRALQSGPTDPARFLVNPEAVSHPSPCGVKASLQANPNPEIPRSGEALTGREVNP